MINTIYTTDDKHKLTVNRINHATKNGTVCRVEVNVMSVKVEKGNKHTELLQSLIMTEDEAGQLARALQKHAMPEIV